MQMKLGSTTSLSKKSRVTSREKRQALEDNAAATLHQAAHTRKESRSGVRATLPQLPSLPQEEVRARLKR